MHPFGRLYLNLMIKAFTIHGNDKKDILLIMKKISVKMRVKKNPLVSNVPNMTL